MASGLGDVLGVLVRGLGDPGGEVDDAVAGSRDGGGGAGGAGAVSGEALPGLGEEVADFGEEVRELVHDVRELVAGRSEDSGTLAGFGVSVRCLRVTPS